MLIRTFRNDEFIDREEEISFLIDWFKETPKEILWLYGPKSCGKTTLIEYVVEKELFEDFENLKPKENYWVRYVNLRGKLISSYETFLESFIKPKDEEEIKKTKSFSARVSASIIQIEAGLLKEVKERKKDLFDVLLNKFENISKEGKQPILIIDEIQTLEDIYINGDRELLKEFLNFCVRLTKETHLSHVIILSSNTIFINKIYNEAKLKITSYFKKVDHLDKKTTLEYLKLHNIPEEKHSLVWDYLGGCIPLIQRMIRHKDKYSSIEDYLNEQVNLALSEIREIMKRFLTKEEKNIFKNIAKQIIKDGFYISSENETQENLRVIDLMSEKEILFYDPQTGAITPNNRVYLKAMEKMLS